MPKCYWHECRKETPTTKMILVREYEDDHGSFYYFCSWWHLMKWLEKRQLASRRPELASRRPEKAGIADERAYLGKRRAGRG